MSDAKLFELIDNHYDSLPTKEKRREESTVDELYNILQDRREQRGLKDRGAAASAPYVPHQGRGVPIVKSAPPRKPTIQNTIEETSDTDSELEPAPPAISAREELEKMAVRMRVQHAKSISTLQLFNIIDNYVAKLPPPVQERETPLLDRIWKVMRG